MWYNKTNHQSKQVESGGGIPLKIRKWRRIAAWVTAAAVIFCGATALAAGTAQDPVISRSYLETVFSAPVRDYLKTALDMMDVSVRSKLDGQRQALADYAAKRMGEVWAQSLTGQVQARVRELLSAQSAGPAASGMRQVTLNRGDTVTGTPGGSVIFVTGAGEIAGPAGSTVLNVTAGSLRTPGLAIKTGIWYMILADDGSGVRVTSDKASVLVRDGARAGYEAAYTVYADALQMLGLFKGTDKGYELERAPQRQEALIMLIRLLGEEPDALATEFRAPFTDMPGWADGPKYISYAYEKGYTNGTSASTFSPYADGTAEQYLTFVLRSLGYRDGEDFVWNTTSRDLAVQLGLVTRTELESIGRTGFMRDHVALISYRALGVRLKAGGGTLADRLLLRGVINWDQLEAASRIAGQ